MEKSGENFLKIFENFDFELLDNLIMNQVCRIEEHEDREMGMKTKWPILEWRFSSEDDSVNRKLEIEPNLIWSEFFCRLNFLPDRV